MLCLARMGYKQELRRQYSTLQVFAIAFSIMGLVPSIASTLSFSCLQVQLAWFGYGTNRTLVSALS